MNWKTRMNLNLIDAQAAAARQAEHERIANELDELIDLAHDRGDESMGRLLCKALALYQRRRWDL